MKSMKKIVLAAGLISTLLASGCSASDAPRKTAEAFLSGMTAGESPEDVSMFKNSPHYKNSVECMTQHLEQSGWTDDDYEKFMKNTDGTGQADRLLDSMSEAEATQFMAPLILSPCM